MSVLSRALFYVDGHSDRFKERHISLPHALQQFHGYNNPTATKHKRASLDVDKLSMHVDRVSGVLLLPFLNGSDYKELKAWANGCCEAMQQMAAYLRQHSIHQIADSTAMEPARQPEQDSSCVIVPACDQISAAYIDLEKRLDSCGEYNIVNVMDYAPASRYERRHFIDKICSKSVLAVFKYHSGGSHQAIVCVWRLPPCLDDRDETRHARCIAELVKKARDFHTRAMRKDFLHRWQMAFQGKASAAALKAIYSELTGDSSMLTNAQENKTREKLLEWILNSDDSDFLLDYHSGSGRLKEGAFEHFWDEVEKSLNEQELAVHERRHGETMFLPVAVSMTSLHKAICDRLDAGPHKGVRRNSTS